MCIYNLGSPQCLVLCFFAGKNESSFPLCSSFLKENSYNKERTIRIWFQAPMEASELPKGCQEKQN